MKLQELLSKAKEYILLAMKYLGQLLGVVKKAEEGLEDKAEDKPDE